MRGVKAVWYPLPVILLGAGLYTGTRVFFLLAFFMIGVTLGALALNLWTVFAFSYIQELDSPTSSTGTANRLRLAIYNDKPFPFTLMGVRVEGAMRSERYALRFNLAPSSHIDFELPIHCGYRGLYSVGMAEVEIHDIFGLLRSRFDMRRLPYYRQRSLKVYPRLTALPALPIPAADAKYHAARQGALSDTGETYADVRRWRPGDPMKRIHPVVSARKRALYVRSYDVPMEEAVLIALDHVPQGPDPEDALYVQDLACELAAAVAHWGLDSGHTVRLAGPDPGMPALEGRSPADFPRLHDALAVLDLDGGDLGAVLAREAAASGGVRAVYVLSARDSAGYAGALRAFARGGAAVRVLALWGRGIPEPRDTGPVPGARRASVAVGSGAAQALGAMLAR